MSIKLYIVVCGEEDGHYPMYTVTGHETVYDTEKIPKLTVMNSVHVYFDESWKCHKDYNNDINTVFDNTKVKLYTKDEACRIVKEIEECKFLHINSKKKPKLVEVNIDLNSIDKEIKENK